MTKAASKNGPESAAVWAPVGELIRWAKNPRKNADAVNDVALSIIRFGFGNPFLARRENKELIAGDTRWQAVHRLAEIWESESERERQKWHPEAVRIKDEQLVPVRFLDISEAEAHLLAVADNKLGEKADWDDDLLREALEAASLKDAQDMGFELRDVDKLLSGPPPELNLDPGGSLSADKKFSVIIECADDAAQARLLSKLREQGYKCKAIVN